MVAMIETHFRLTYQKLCVNWVAQRLANKVSHHTITAAALILGVVSAFALIKQHILLATIFLLLSGYCDTLDGTIARMQNTSSAFGSMLDIVGDRIVEIAIVLALFSLAPSSRAWLSLGMLSSMLICITSFLVVGIYQENNSTKGFHYSVGLIERAEAFAFFLAMMWLPAYFKWLAISFIILVLMTSLIRIYEFYQHYSSK
jgi:archaetidylinositol phosphate synthase